MNRVLLPLLLLAAVGGGDSGPNAKMDDGESHPPPPVPANSSSRISFQAQGPNATARSLTAVLDERRSVTDYGASGQCYMSGTRCTYAECCPTDDTPAFERAFAAHISFRKTGKNPPGWTPTIYVPSGSYRIDGTIRLRGQELVLAKGATLLRVAIANNTAPVVQLTGAASRLTGSGTVRSALPSPRGVVCIGPANLSRADNIEYSLVEGITIDGPGVSYKNDGSDADVSVRGSVALNMDSSQGHA